MARVIPYLVLAAMLALRIADPPIIQQARLLVFDAYQLFQPFSLHVELQVCANRAASRLVFINQKIFL